MEIIEMVLIYDSFVQSVCALRKEMIFTKSMKKVNTLIRVHLIPYKEAN